MSIDESTVLLIDNKASRSRQLHSILEFLDIEQVRAVTYSDWQPLDSDEMLHIVLLGGGDTPAAVNKLFTALREYDNSVPVILFREDLERGAYPDELVKEAMGVIDHPLRYRQLFKFLQQAQVYRNNQTREVQRRASPELFRSLVGNSRSTLLVRKLIDQVAMSEANVLILGDSGTGKEVVARNIHYSSGRRDKPFVPINCGAIPTDLLESELFGHEKGAFTGAISARQGRFELAEGGTLFLDEIGDMSLHMQVKLLRVLQERTFERIGSNKSIHTNARIIAATHQNLEHSISQGDFREDLFYRLNVFPIEVPPLREHAEDIPLLINELITRLEHENRGSVRLTPAAVISLCQYPWPGNVRELANLVERLVIMYPMGVVEPNDLPEKFQTKGTKSAALPVATSQFAAEVLEYGPPMMPRLPKDGVDLKEHLASLECHFIQQALEEANGVVAHAASRLKLRRTTLVEKMRKYGLQRMEEAS